MNQSLRIRICLEVVGGCRNWGEGREGEGGEAQSFPQAALPSSTAASPSAPQESGALQEAGRVRARVCKRTRAHARAPPPAFLPQPGSSSLSMASLWLQKTGTTTRSAGGGVGGRLEDTRAGAQDPDCCRRGQSSPEPGRSALPRGSARSGVGERGREGGGRGLPTPRCGAVTVPAGLGRWGRALPRPQAR